MFQKTRDILTGRSMLVALPLLASAVGASAQTVDAFDQAVTDVTAKVTGYGPKLVGIAAVSVIFFVALKYVKKIPRAS